MQLHGAEVVDMMKVVTWCLQSDFAMRPSMSVVVKVLEGVVGVEENIDFNFCNPTNPNTSKSHASGSKCWWCHSFIRFYSIRPTVTIHNIYFCFMTE